MFLVGGLAIVISSSNSNTMVGGCWQVRRRLAWRWVI
jgi:hypothetical protein